MVPVVRSLWRSDDNEYSLKGPTFLVPNSKVELALEYPENARPPSVVLKFIAPNQTKRYLEERKEGKFPYPQNLRAFGDVRILPKTKRLGQNRMQRIFAFRAREGGYLCILLPPRGSRLSAPRNDFHVFFISRRPSRFPPPSPTSKDGDEMTDLLIDSVNLCDKFARIFLVCGVLFFVKHFMNIDIDGRLQAKIESSENPPWVPVDEEIIEQLMIGRQLAGVEYCWLSDDCAPQKALPIDFTGLGEAGPGR